MGRAHTTHTGARKQEYIVLTSFTTVTLPDYGGGKHLAAREGRHCSLLFWK